MVSIYAFPYTIRWSHDVACLRANGLPFVSCTDPDLCTLVAAQHRAAGAYEAFCDGAIGACDDVNAEHARLSRAYDSASSALINFRRLRRGVHPDSLGEDMRDHESL